VLPERTYNEMHSRVDLEHEADFACYSCLFGKPVELL